MSLDDAIQLIRGKKGTEVRLTVRKPDESIVVISIIRDVVVMEDSYARSAIIKMGDADYGYINLPSFYIDMNDHSFDERWLLIQGCDHCQEMGPFYALWKAATSHKEQIILGVVFPFIIDTHACPVHVMYKPSSLSVVDPYQLWVVQFTLNEVRGCQTDIGAIQRRGPALTGPIGSTGTTTGPTGPIGIPGR